MDIARWIRTTRQERGETVTAAARAIGVHRISLVRWEGGRRTPQVAGLRAIARWAGVDVATLL